MVMFIAWDGVGELLPEVSATGGRGGSGRMGGDVLLGAFCVASCGVAVGNSFRDATPSLSAIRYINDDIVWVVAAVSVTLSSSFVKFRSNLDIRSVRSTWAPSGRLPTMVPALGPRSPLSKSRSRFKDD